MLRNLIQKKRFLQEKYQLEQNLVDEDDHLIDNNKERIQNKHDDDQKNILGYTNSNKVCVYHHFLIMYRDIIVKLKDTSENDFH
jgi:hypothetical protein